MSRRKKKKRRRNQQQRSKRPQLTSRQRWIYGTVFLFIFGLTLFPYISDVIQSPDPGNAFLLALCALFMVGVTVLILRSA